MPKENTKKPNQVPKPVVKEKLNESTEIPPRKKKNTDKK